VASNVGGKRERKASGFSSSDAPWGEEIGLLPGTEKEKKKRWLILAERGGGVGLGGRGGGDGMTIDQRRGAQA